MESKSGSYERLLDIVRVAFCAKPEELKRDTVLQSFGFDGIDAMNFCDAIFEAFPIDWSEFRYHDYFCNEPPGLFDGPKYELTIGELYDAIVAGKWSPPSQEKRKRLYSSSELTWKKVAKLWTENK